MAYETPPTQSSGHIITASEWNQIVNDIIETAAAKFTVKGDLLVATGANVGARLGVPNSPTIVANNGAWLVTASGETTGLKWLVPQYCKLHRVTNVTITSGTLTAIIFDGTMEDSDASGLHDGVATPTKIISGVAGKYYVGGQAQFQSHAGGTYRLAAIHKNGTEIAKSEMEHNTAGPTPTCNLAMMIPLSVNDYIELRVKHDAGTGINIQEAMLWAFLVTEH